MAHIAELPHPIRTHLDISISKCYHPARRPRRGEHAPCAAPVITYVAGRFEAPYGMSSTSSSVMVDQSCLRAGLLQMSGGRRKVDN